MKSSKLNTLEALGAKMNMTYYISMTRYTYRYSLKAMALISFNFVLISGSSGQTNRTRVFTSDIYNFWKAYDSVKTTDNAARQIGFMQTLYIQKVTAGLKAFMKLRNFDATPLVTTINTYPKLWESVRPNTLLVKNWGNQINSYFQKFQKLYPDYWEAKIYFNVCHLGPTDRLALTGH